MIDHSPASILAERMVYALGKEFAHRALDVALKKFSNVELAALAARWEFWARSKQLPPRSNWRSWGFLSGRGFGKTLAVSKHINEEVREGRSILIGLIAQDEANCVAVQVLGPSGLIATAPPWMRPEWEASKLELVWPNGARAYVRTPEVPGKIRGLEYHLFWATEIQSWPVATREEAYSNVLLSTRLGYARFVWDATPKKRHPILLERLRMATEEPERHLVVRGTTHENKANLGVGYVEDLERKYGNTQKGREELGGEMLDDAEGALVKQAWIDDHRRPMPERFVRRVLGVDPAVTTRAGSDQTGIVGVGLGVDSQVYVLRDLTGKHDAPTWAKLVLDAYVTGYDLVVVETNKGGNLLVQNLRAAAAQRKLAVEVVDEKWQPHLRPGTVFVREIHSRGPKEDRAQPLATAYEAGRISHVIGANLLELETTLTTWEPAPGVRSPDGLDALVHAVGEVAALAMSRQDMSQGFKGIGAMAAALGMKPQQRGAGNIAALLGARGTGGRI